MPIPSLTDDQARTLARAIAKASRYDRDRPARELAGDREAGFALIWMLQERGMLELGRYPGMWDDLAHHLDGASAHAVVGLLRGVGEDDDDSDDDDDDDSDDDSDDDDDDDSDDSDDDSDSDDDDSDDDDNPFAALEREHGVDDDDDDDPYFDAWAGFWSEDLDRIVLTGFLRDPSAFEGLEGELAPALARGLASVRLRAGQELPDALREAVGAGFAKMMVHGDGGPSELLMVDDGVIVESSLFDYDHDRPSAHALRLIEQLGGEATWRRHVLAAALGASADRIEIMYAREAFIDVDVGLMAYLLSRVSWDADNLARAYEILLHERHDPPEALMAAADALGAHEPHVERAELCRTCAVLRWARRGDAVPASVDATLRLRGHRIGHPPRELGFVGLPYVLEALAALGRDRASTLLRERLEGSLEDAVHAVPCLAAVPDPALVELALDKVGRRLGEALDACDEDAVIFGWRALGEAGLAGLVALHDALQVPAVEPAPAKATKGKKGRGKAGKGAKAAKAIEKTKLALHRAVLVSLEAAIEHDGGELDERWDRWLAVDTVAGDDDRWEEELGPTVRRVLRAVGPGRRERLFESWLERGGPELPRVLAFLDLVPAPLRVRALERFALAPEARVGDREWLSGAAGRIGVALHEPIRALLAAHPEAQARVAGVLDGDLLRAIVHGPRSETTEALRQRAAKVAAGGPSVTIHVLEPWSEVKVDASTVSRVGPVAVGVPPERWPADLDGNPMRHVLTLRLRDVPELAPRHPDKVALAVFLAHGGGHAYEPDSDDAAVLLLDADDLAAGESYVGPARDEDLDEDDDLLPYFDPDTRPLLAFAVDLPLAALEADEGASKPLQKLREQVAELSARAGGPPQWLGGEGHDGRFVLQLDDGFESLGIDGVWRLFVFDDTALWQSLAHDE